MTTLYIKTHNTTGLKYFGKTTQKDPYKYKGSGTYWTRHLKVYGNDVSTEIYAQIDEQLDLKLLETTALKFSKDNDIINSTEWANLMLENGFDGSVAGELHPNYGIKRSDETKEKMGNAASNREFGKSQEQKEEISQKMSQAHKNRSEEDQKERYKKINDTKQNIHNNRTGEEKETYHQKLSNSHKGLETWNKGRKETRVEVLEKLRTSHLGQEAWNKGQTGGTNKIKGRIYPKVECPHCKKMVGENSKGRYHFDNCKYK